MPLVLGRQNDKGGKDILVILGDQNFERMKANDPFQIQCDELPWDDDITSITVSYADDDLMGKIEAMARQGKVEEALKLANKTLSGFKYRPDLGDHDEGPEVLYEN